jgi:APA family basic amino acid/polyamine antiporter
VGAAIGGGILRVPAFVASELPHPGWIALLWLLVTGFVFIDANTHSELSAMIPKAGGSYVFVTRAFGEFPGFVVGWTDWVINVAAIAYISVAFADVASELSPGIRPLGHLIAVTLIGGFTALHSVGVHVGGRAQLTLSAVKVVGFLVVVAACLWFAPHPASAVSGSLPPAPSLGFAALIAAFVRSWQLTQETYAGSMSAVYFAEESNQPGRSMPRAIFGSVLVVAVVYLSTVAMLLYVLGAEHLAQSTLPLAEAARVALGDRSRDLVLVVALLSLLGLVSANVMLTPRILFAIARDGLFARAATRVNAGGTPALALFITSALGIALALTNTFQQLFSITSFLTLIMILATNASLFALRYREPDLQRPFQAWGYPWLPTIGVAVPSAVAIGALRVNTRNSVIGLALIALAYPVFRRIRETARAQP